MSDVKKTRNLPLVDYLKQLQLEYICAELRSKIYPEVNNKKFYKTLMERKRAKFEDICTKNGELPNILNNKELKYKLYKEIYGDKGLPKFLYKDESSEITFKESDIRNYYSIGADVKISLEDSDKKIIFAKIIGINLKAEIVEVEERESGKHLGIFNMNDVTRIL